MNIKEYQLKKKDPAMYEIQRLRAEMADMQTKGLKDIAEVVFERKVDEMKTEIQEQLETYVGDVTQTLVEKNLRGETGTQGEKGEKGDKGDTGANGIAGADGINGKDGKDGKDGKNGIDGMKGKDGKDGKSVAVEEIVAFIKPEIDKFIVEAKRTIKSMKPAGGGGGGGMSNPTTFSFTGNDATTQFTLSTNVAANGMAIWAYLNGQWIQPGVHFNVSGRTFTTTFTPATGDTIEGFYLRT